MEASVAPASRLPGVGLTVFARMSQLAAECGAINLAQGFPDFAPVPALLQALSDAAAAGPAAHQYAPMGGLPSLRAAIAHKLSQCYGASYDAEDEITVTAGATQALFTAIAALVQPGDEVICFYPAYDAYAPAVLLQGGSVKWVALKGTDWQPDWAGFDAVFGARTRLVILNSPHNPTASLWSAASMQCLAQRLQHSACLVLADEVYEHMVFDGARHESVARHPALAARALGVSSFGKTYHATGWKVGYVFAPRALMAEFRKLHQFNVFAVNTPAQLALATLAGDAASWQGLASFYAAKRERLRAALAASGLRVLPCAATYFQLVDYSALSDLADHDFVEHLARQHGVAAIPLSAFMPGACEARVIRLCFAKQDATLDAACARLARL